MICPNCQCEDDGLGDGRHVARRRGTSTLYYACDYVAPLTSFDRWLALEARATADNRAADDAMRARRALRQLKADAASLTFDVPPAPLPDAPRPPVPPTGMDADQPAATSVPWSPKPGTMALLLLLAAGLGALVACLLDAWGYHAGLTHSVWPW